MIRLLLISLVMVCVMPSSPAAAKKSLGDYYDTQARYRSHHRHRTRARHKPHFYEPVRALPATKEVARPSLEPFDQQEPIRWTSIDISDLLKPMEMKVLFPPDTGKFKLPADPPALDSLLPGSIEQRTTLYLFALAILGILGTGMASELNKARTCHKRGRYGLQVYSKAPNWVLAWVKGRREALRSLT